MQDIAELEGRITAALERISQGLDRQAAASRSLPPGTSLTPAPALTPELALSPPPALTPELLAKPQDSGLRAQLEQEKSLTAQLQDRLRSLKERDQKSDQQLKVDRLTDQLDTQGLELQRMRRTNASLRDQLASLRAAQIDGFSEPQLINKSMLAELDALRALRLTEVAEMDEILLALEPHLEEADRAGS